MANKNSKISKPWLISTLCGALLFLVSGFGVAIGGLINWIAGGTYTTSTGATIGYGIRMSMKNYWGLWRPWSFPISWGYFGLTFLFIAIVIFLAELVLVIAKKKYLLIINVLLHGITLGFLPYLMILGVTLWESGHGAGRGGCLVVLMSLFAVLATFLVSAPICGIFAKKEAPAAKPEVEEKPAEQEEEVPGLSEDEVRRLIAEELERHINELHTEEFEEVTEEEVKPEPEPEPEPEEAEPDQPEEEPEGEAEEEDEEVAEGDAEEPEEDEEGETDPDDPFAKLRRRRRASFETRLKKSEADLRHKYYELRDYIKSYGIKNRISIPGDTFSAHRERYCFLTIQGKHIKAYFPLDVAAYEDSPIPVKKVEAKKFEDLPLMLKVQSDLSLKRAKQLVDDVMAARGVSKPEGEEAAE